MPPDRSELSSIATLLEQLTARIASMGEAAVADRDDAGAAELFAIERALSGASRRITRILGAGRGAR
jgi:hypothetical protein